MGSAAWAVLFLFAWLAVIGLAAVLGWLADHPGVDKLAELPAIVWADDHLQARPGAEPTEADLNRLGHLFLTGMTPAEMISRGPGFLPTTPGTQLQWSAAIARGPRARLAHIWHRRARFACGYCQAGLPPLEYITPASGEG